MFPVQAGRGRRSNITTIAVMEPMDWSRIAGNWPHWRGRLRERWGRLTEDQLDSIAGRREQLTARIQELYGVGQDEAERQLRNWERSLTVEMEMDPMHLIERGTT
jgi:uncharacterized protein YjbJ (UPF0337 family)